MGENTGAGFSVPITSKSIVYVKVWHGGEYGRRVFRGLCYAMAYLQLKNGWWGYPDSRIAPVSRLFFSKVFTSACCAMWSFVALFFEAIFYSTVKVASPFSKAWGFRHCPYLTPRR